MVSTASSTGEELSNTWESWNIGLQLKWNLYTGGRIQAKSNASRHRVNVATEKLRRKKKELAGEVDRPCYMVEEYPTWDRLEVERWPVK